MDKNVDWISMDIQLSEYLDRFSNKYLKLIDAINKKIKSSPDCIGKVKLLILLSDFHRTNSVGFRSLDLINEAVLIAKKLQNLSLVADTYRAKGLTLKSINASDHEALSLFLDALELRKKLGQKRLEISQLKEIAGHHFDFGDENRAISYYEEVIKKGEGLVRYDLIIDSWNAIGLINRRNGVYDTAIAYFEKGIEIATKQNSEIWIGILKGNIGDTYFLQEKYDEAIPLLEIDLESSIKFNATRNLSKLYKTLGEIFLNKNQLDKAEDYLIKAIGVGRTRKQYSIVAECYILLAEIKARLGDDKISLDYYKKSLYLKDSLTDLISLKEKQIAEIDRIYDIRSREKYEQQLQKVNIEQSVVIEKQKIWNMIIAFVVVVISIISITLFSLIRKRKKVAQKLSEQYRIILDQKEEIQKFNEKLEAEVIIRTQELKKVNKELREYAFMNSHTVRGPLARILGLFYLLENKLHSKEEEEEIIQKAVFEANVIDEVLHEISRKLETH